MFPCNDALKGCGCYPYRYSNYETLSIWDLTPKLGPHDIAGIRISPREHKLDVPFLPYPDALNAMELDLPVRSGFTP